MFQQIITYEIRNSQMHGFTGIDANLMYNPDEEGGNYPKVPDIVRTASYTGLYFSGNFSDPLQHSMLYPHVECASGNCSYPVFDSLAVCNVCTNVTDDIMVLPGTGNYTLPNGFNTGRIDLRATWPGYISSGRLSSTVRVRPQFPLLNFTQMSLSSNGADGPTATATECVLHWCVNRYQTWVSNGVLHEEVISSSTANGPKVSEFYSVNGPPNTNISFSVSDAHEPQPPVGYPGSPLPASYPCERNRVDSSYCPTTDGTTPLERIDGAALVGLEASMHLGSFVGDLLTGYSSLVLNTGATIQSMSYNDSDVVRRLHRTDNATLSMDILARALTTAIREYVRTGGAGHFTNQGWIWKSEVHVRVRWAWMALPILLEISTLALLLTTIWDTSAVKTDIWKNSSLAVLFHGGPKRDVVETDTEIRDVISMEKIAQKRNVRLKDVGSGRIELD